MSLLDKLKSILGLSDSTTTRDRERVGVTVERDPEAEASSAPADGTDLDRNAVETATVDEPNTAGVTADETVADETAADETAADETAADETAADETAADETVADETAADVAEGATDDDTTEAATEEPAPTEEVTTSDGADDGDGEPTTEITGIGASYSNTLAEAGVETVSELAAADASDLDERTGLGENRIAGWIDAARARNE